MANASGNSANNFFKSQHPNSFQPVNSNDRLIWEMRNARHHNYQYYNRTPNTTPSSTVLNSPDLNEISDFKLMEHYQDYNQQFKATGLIDNANFSAQNILDSQSSITKYANPYELNDLDSTLNNDSEQTNSTLSWKQQHQQPMNSLNLLALSPTSSQSSTNSSTQAQVYSNETSRSRVIGMTKFSFF
jgi:hypothetical protein